MKNSSLFTHAFVLNRLNLESQVNWKSLGKQRDVDFTAKLYIFHYLLSGWQAELTALNNISEAIRNLTAKQFEKLKVL